MAPPGFARVRVEATTTPDNRPVVYLYLNGYRLELYAPTTERARQIAWSLIVGFGLDTDG